MADKTVKAKQPEKPKRAENAGQIEKAKPVQKAAKPADKEHDKPKQPNAIVRWWRETVGELRKVSWPSYADARRLTQIVLIVMFGMALVLGLLDWVFSQIITLLVS